MDPSKSLGELPLNWGESVVRGLFSPPTHTHTTSPHPILLKLKRLTRRCQGVVPLRCLPIMVGLQRLHFIFQRVVPRSVYPLLPVSRLTGSAL